MMRSGNDSRAERLRQAILAKKDARPGALALSPRPAGQPAYLADMQRSLWLVHQLDRRSPAYNVASAFRVRGVLDLVRVQQAYNQVVSRHRLLRSTFRAERGTVLQVVHPHAPLALDVLEADDRGALAAATEAARAPFDLETGPLVRLRLVEKASGGERLLLLVLHHILADEASLGLLWKELAAAYEGRLPDAEPGVQYDDYVHWLRQAGAGAREEEIAYWRRRLAPMPLDLRLPFERPAAAGGEAAGRLVGRVLDDTVASAIRRIAAAIDGTPFTVFAFAFRLLLHRYTNGQRIAFATPVSTRAHPATADMIGYFLNPVVVSTHIDEAQPVEQALRCFGRELRDVLAHASLSFQALAEALSPPRHRDRHPIFQAMFVYQEPGPPPKLGEVRLDPVTLDLGASKFDLTLFVTLGERSLEIAVEYRGDRFDEAWMQGLLDHYEALLEGLPRDLQRATADVSMLGTRQQHQLRACAQGPDLDTADMTPLPRQILQRARRAPQAAAVACGVVRRSYADLERSARAIARALADRGVKPGDRVGVFLERSVLMIAGLVGSHWAAAAYVPLDPAYPEARNRDLLDDAEVAAVLTTSTLRARLPDGPWTVIDVDRLDDDPGFEVRSDAPSHAPAYILYTSGSTGRPKGVIVSHGNLAASTRARLQVYDTPPERFLLVPSVAFDSSVAGIFWTLAVGGALVIPTDDEARDPRRLAELAARERVTTVLCVPSLYAQLLVVGGDLLQGLHTAIVAGESCSSRLVDEHFRVLPRVRLFNEYGPTEATVWATVHEITEQDASRPVAIGRPIPGVRVDVLDALGRRVPAGIPGHAWIAGPTVAQGYWRRPDLTAERFVGEEGDGAHGNRYRTGDQVAWTADGRLLFMGREDEQIKLRGFRIEPGEIEAALLEHPDVHDAAVVARGLGSGIASVPGAENTGLVAFVRTTGTGVHPSWRQDLAKRLPDHMIPSRLVGLPDLPRLPNGKVDRQRLRDMPLESEGQAASPREVLTTREQALVSLWEGLLARVGIRSTDNFFELGGHSLLVIEMVLAIERDCEVTLSAADVFENPTVQELARRIEQRRRPDAPTYRHLFPIQAAGRGRPFVVAVPHFFSETFAARFRGERPVYGLRGVSLRPEGNYGRWRTMTDLGEELVEEILRRFPDESCILAGYSFGASMAFEVVRLMEARGIPVHRLYLIAPMPFDFYRFGPFRLQLDALREPADGLSVWEALRLYARSNHPFTRRPYDRAWRRLGIQSWRRLLCMAGQLRGWAGLPLTPRILHADVRVERFRLHAQYKPGPVHTPAVIFNASGTETDAAATWRPCFRGPLTVHETPDPHEPELVDAARETILRHLGDMEDA